MSPTPDWSKIASDPDFHALQRAKRRFIIPATIFFLAYYMALPIMVGYWPEAMKRVASSLLCGETRCSSRFQRTTSELKAMILNRTPSGN